MSDDMRQEDTNMKFKNLPQKEQEGYVINYTDPIKIKIYLLCYQNVEKAIKKLKENDKDALSIDTIIRREDTEEHIKASANDTIPVIKVLISEGKYFHKKRDCQTLAELVEKESRALNMIPKEFVTDELVDHAIKHQKYLHVRDIPARFMTAKRFVTLCKKDWSAVNWLSQYIDLLSDENLLEVICENSGGLREIPIERWNKDLLYHYLEYCVRNYKDTGFTDYMIKLPDELKDKVFYQCCCMTGGFHYSKIPENLKKIVISWKLIAETIRRWDIYDRGNGNHMYYNGLGWMLQYLPEEFKSKEVCLEVCKRYPYAIRYVPNEFVEDDSFWNELLSNGCYTPLLNLEKDQEKHLSNKYRDFKKEVTKDDELHNGSYNPKTEEDWKLFLSKHGAKITEMPNKFLTVDMLLIAMRSNSFAVERNTDIIDKLSDVDKESFWKKVVEEKLFNRPISVPDEYMSEDVICEWVKGKYCYDTNDISKVYRTENVLVEFAKAHPDRFTFGYEEQTQSLIDTMMSLQTKDICKGMYLKKVRPDLRRKELVDELCISVPREMISLDTITKEQIDGIISRFPGLIVEAPMWYIRELRADGEHNSVKNMEDKKMSLSSENNSLIDGPLNVPLKKQIEFTDIRVDEWEQISFFDLLGA